ncbi:unnamed protein product [Closterium sp. NIES-53]
MGEVVDVLIPWIRAIGLQLRKRFRADPPVLRLHSDRGVMEVTSTSMIHAAAPHFLWPFAVRYAVHQLNLWPHVSLPETSPTLRWTGKFGDASALRVWGSRAFVRDTSADKLSARAIPCVLLGFFPDAPGRQFYHPTLRRVFSSQDVTFDESVPIYWLFPYRSPPPPPPPLFLAPGPPPVDPLLPQGPAPSCVSQIDPLLETVPVESGGAEPRGTASCGGPAGASPRMSSRPEPLSPQQLCEWFTLRTHLQTGVTGAGDSAAGDTGAGGGRLTAGAGGTEVLHLLVLEVLVPRVLELPGLPDRHHSHCRHYRHPHRCHHRLHQSPHSRHHSHYRHHLHYLHHLHCCPHHHPRCHRHHPYHPCPCCCGTSH